MLLFIMPNAVSHKLTVDFIMCRSCSGIFPTFSVPLVLDVAALVA